MVATEIGSSDNSSQGFGCRRNVNQPHTIDATAKPSARTVVASTTANLEPPPALTMLPNKKIPGNMLARPPRIDAILDRSDRS